MPDSPIFARCDTLVLWVLQATVRYPRHYRAALGKATQEAALLLQRELIAAARRRGCPLGQARCAPGRRRGAARAARAAAPGSGGQPAHAEPVRACRAAARRGRPADRRLAQIPRPRRHWRNERGVIGGSWFSPCHPVTLSPCHPVTLSPVHPRTGVQYPRACRDGAPGSDQRQTLRGAEQEQP